jgi:hypothetical protein
VHGPATPVSVVVGTIEPWPTIRACLDRLVPQVAAAGGQLILADGTPASTGGPPSGLAAYASVQVLTKPGSSIFALRAMAAEASTGALVAFTEDHCLVHERWLGDLVAAARAHPEADLIAGGITNGSSEGLIDWANFLMTFAEFLPPAPERPLRRAPLIANALFRRSTMMAGRLPEGWIEVVLTPTLAHEHRVHYDASITVSHVQPRTLRRALAAHFDNGRACAGLARPHMAWRDWLVRMATVPVLPWILFVSVLRSVRGRSIPPRARRSLPAVWLLCAAHALGEVAGLTRGEGASAQRLN